MSNKQRYGHPEPKLLLIVSKDINARAESLVAWNLMRLSLTMQEVAVDYDCNYSPPIGGSQILKVFLGKEVCKNTIPNTSFQKHLYQYAVVPHGYLSHSCEYALVNPSETYKINRVLFVAAERAKLKPVVDLSVKIFQHFII